MHDLDIEALQEAYENDFVRKGISFYFTNLEVVEFMGDIVSKTEYENRDYLIKGVLVEIRNLIECKLQFLQITSTVCLALLEHENLKTPKIMNSQYNAKSELLENLFGRNNIEEVFSCEIDKIYTTCEGTRIFLNTLKPRSPLKTLAITLLQDDTLPYINIAECYQLENLILCMPSDHTFGNLYHDAINDLVLFPNKLKIKSNFE